MEGFWLVVLVTVVAGVILSVITAVGRAAWKKVTRLPSWLRQVVRHRRRTRHMNTLKAVRRDLRERSETVGEDLPWSRDRTWRGPGTRVIWRSGSDSFYIDPYQHGIGQYEAAIRSGVVPRQRTFRTPPPRVVEDWTASDCETWLENHPEPEP